MFRWQASGVSGRRQWRSHDLGGSARLLYPVLDE